MQVERFGSGCYIINNSTQENYLSSSLINKLNILMVDRVSAENIYDNPGLIAYRLHFVRF